MFLQKLSSFGDIRIFKPAIFFRDWTLQDNGTLVTPI